LRITRSVLVVTEEWGISFRGLNPLRSCGEILGFLARSNSWCGDRKAHPSSSTVRAPRARRPFLVFHLNILGLKSEPQESGDDG